MIEGATTVVWLCSVGLAGGQGFRWFGYLARFAERHGSEPTKTPDEVIVIAISNDNL
jgi:hypothetical protein